MATTLPTVAPAITVVVFSVFPGPLFVSVDELPLRLPLCPLGGVGKGAMGIETVGDGEFAAAESSRNSFLSSSEFHCCGNRGLHTSQRCSLTLDVLYI